MSKDRPLSPHLTVYRIDLSMVLSMGHRLSGLVLSIGTLFFTWWIVALAQGKEAYDSLQSFFGNPLGILCLLGLSVCFGFHLCSGVRHLIWDLGYGLSPPEIRQSQWWVLAGTAGFTLLTWILVLL